MWGGGRLDESFFFFSLALCWVFFGGVFHGDPRLTSVRNRGELAEGWYDPATLQKAIKSAAETNAPSRTPARRRASPDYGSQPENDKATTESSNDDDDNDNDDIGPALPNADSKPHKHHRSGPAIPSLQDLELRRGTTSSSHPANVHKPPLTPSPELLASDAQTAHQSLQHDRHQTRHQALSQLNELAPRADPGTRERQLEKKREKAEAHRSFAAGRVDAGDPIEVADADLLGGGEEEGFRKRKGEVERKKNEREVRREEVARARMEEREERVRAYREREERTMRGLVELAKARFG